MFTLKEMVLLCSIYATVQAYESLNPALVLYSNDCGCLTYQCTINGEGAIIWRGSSFECGQHTDNEISLLFLDRGTVAECNNGTIKAERYNYSSQLIITDSTTLSGSNIECIHDNITNLTAIGNLSIAPSDSLPLTDLYLSNVSAGQLIFKWSNVQCSSLRYEINATGCGICPNHTLNNIITCEDVSIETNSTEESLCMFAVKAVVCENNNKTSSKINVTLKVPLVTITEVLPTYLHHKSQELVQLAITFTDSVGSFNFSDTVDGSALIYSINYMDSNSSSLCASAEVPATSCLNQTCEYIFTKSNFLACLTLSQSIMVTVFGANRLGNGSRSDPVSIETTNKFVEVSQNSTTVICMFKNWQNGSNSTCTIEYRTYNSCDDNTHSMHILYTKTSSSNSDIVEIDVTDSPELSPATYCFIVMATNGSFTAKVKGSFSIHTTDTNTKIETVTVAIVILMVGTIILLGLTITITAVYVKKRSKSTNEIQAIDTRDTLSEEEHYTLPPGLHSNSQEKGVYSLLQPVEESEAKNGDMIYADIGPNTAKKGKVMLPLHDDRVEYSQIQHTQTETSYTESKTSEAMDEQVNLDNLLIQLRDEVSPKWYELGDIVGVPKEILDKCSGHPSDQCIIEVLDYWLIHYRGQLTWKDVAHALKEINLHQLSEKILQIHEKRQDTTLKIDIDLVTDSLPHEKGNHQFQQNLDSVALSMSLSKPQDAEQSNTFDRSSAAELTDTNEDTNEDTAPPPPLPPKCEELMDCMDDLKDTNEDMLPPPPVPPKIRNAKN